MNKKRFYPIKGVVQHYSWGGYQYIPALINTDNSEGKPFAEYWLGAHPKAPAKWEGGDLRELISSYPKDMLGAATAESFGSLPFLFKVLDVRQMLSIQVHPTKSEAEKGFQKENEKGIALDAGDRNYKDNNHKPELMAALSDFWLLHGFKPEAALRSTLQKVEGFTSWLPIFDTEGYKGLYHFVMTMPQQEVDAVLEPLAKRIMPLYRDGKLNRSSEDFWAARAMETYTKDGHYDRGIFSIYLFNLVYLRKGEGIYQGAGLPHAYLEGQNIEVMANSDNVLRAGLTDKHIDIGELMKHVLFEPTEPKLIPPSGGNHTVYEAPVAEFCLHHYQVNSGSVNMEGVTAQLSLVVEGKLMLEGEGEQLALGKGESVFIPPGSPVLARAEGEASLFTVSVPLGRKFREGE